MQSGSDKRVPPRCDAAVPALTVSGLSIAFETDRARIEAVRSVDLTLGRGEILGLVGESGSGKSVTCQALLGLLPQTARVTGRIAVAGSSVDPADTKAFASLRGRTLSMIFQDPMSALDPLMTIRGHLLQRLRRHGYAGDPQMRAADLLVRAGIADARRVLGCYPHQLSGGLCQRAVIALALAGEPHVLVADEPTTALDVTIQAQVLDLIADLRRTTGLAVILISHDLGVVAEICDRVAVMYAGQIVESGPVDAVLQAPAHPYTKGLLASRPDLDAPRSGLRALRGFAPAPDDVPSGCAFAPRCLQVRAACAAMPGISSPEPGRTVRCHFPADQVTAPPAGPRTPSPVVDAASLHG